MIESDWENTADWYAAKLAAGSPIHQWTLGVLLAHAGAVQGEAVLDLGCGEGLIARGLAGRGARVTGVDLSERMLTHARDQEVKEPLGIEYRRVDARSLDGLRDGEFAGTVANLALCDIPDLEAVFAAVWRVLHEDGWFVFSIPHPCFETPHATWSRTAEGVPARLVNAYYDEVFWRSTDPQGVRRVGNYHRTLSSYLNALVGAGFVIDRVTEPLPSKSMIDLEAGRAQVPLLLVVRALRGSG